MLKMDVSPAVNILKPDVFHLLCLTIPRSKINLIESVLYYVLFGYRWGGRRRSQ